MTRPIDISPDHLKMVSDILNKHLPPDTRVWVFGSRAKWETTDASDLDLAVEGPRPVDHGTMTELDVAFDDSDLPYTVDVVDLKTVSDSFKKIINTQKVPLLFVNQNDNLRTQSSETTLIPKGWINAIFSDVVDINPKRNLRKGATVKFVSMENLKPFVRTASNYTIKNYSGGSKFQNGDTLFARITPSLENGKTAYVDFLDEDEVGAGSTEFIILTPKDKRLDPLFVYYLSRTTWVRDIAIKSMTGTSGRQLVEDDIFKKINVAMPSVLEQKTIVKILSDLDSKIELNYQMNKILEEMVRALFKSWFVDFDPVRAKTDGRWRSGESLLGLPAHIYNLFPDRLVNSELGEMPRGWATGTYSDLVCVETGKKLERSKYVINGKFPVMGANGELGKTNKFLFDDDLIITGRVGTLGVVKMVHGKLWLSDNVLISKPKSRNYFYYAYYVLKSFDLSSLNRGSSQPLLTQTDLKNCNCFIPSIKLLIEFENIVSSLFAKVHTNTIQNNILEYTRDTLLPKLMSGKIRIQTGARR